MRTLEQEIKFQRGLGYVFWHGAGNYHDNPEGWRRCRLWAERAYRRARELMGIE